MNEFEADAPAATKLSQEGLSRVSMLAQQLITLSAQRDLLDEQLKERKEQVRKLEEELLPDAMLALGLEQIKLDDGSSVRVDTVYHAEIPKRLQVQAFQWLRENNYDSMIKNEIKAQFGKGEDQLAAQMNVYCQQHSIDITAKQAVHPQTLKAFVREKAEAGAPVPVDLFGVHVRKVAQVKR